jgi:acetolactate synthase-1/2/3 large subunit
MEQVRTLAERLQIPVASALLGLGAFPASHELSLGMMGMHGEAWVNKAIQKSDLIIACGMRFGDRVTGVLTRYAPNAKKIHIEIDPSEINKNVKVDVALVGDLREILETILARIEPRKDNSWLHVVNVLKGDAAVRDIKNLPDLGHLYAAHVINDLCRATEGKALIVTDVGQHQMWGRNTASTIRRAACSLRADWEPWALPCQPRSAPRSPVQRKRSGSSPAMAASK